MDEDELEVVSVDDDSQGPSDTLQETPKRSGLTLVLPSLKSLQQAKKSKKPPRPAKLKPLKEVLAKLIGTIKKKDGYGFFLEPVNAAQVPGYADIIKQPMDLGTVTNKVARGKYRSLDDFTNDIRLVTGNAKLFNPPGTIYHAEAEKLEMFALEHIEKASATVIQYETDWNLDPEKDESDNFPSPSPSTAPAGFDVDPELYLGVRRSTRAPYKKTATATPAANGNASKGLSESIGPDGSLPGSKDGLGVFPPGSDLAKTMLDLKLKGKRYKTKKERMRIEKDGPPFRPDGSLDYYNMEEPFTIFAGLVPTPLTRPTLIPIYPPATPAQTSQPQSNDPSQMLSLSLPQSRTQSQTPQPSSSFPLPTTVPLNRPLDEPKPPKVKQWIVSRNSNLRRGKDKEDENDESGNDWKVPREPHATDFGSLAVLAGELAEEMKRRGMTGEAGDVEQKTVELLRDSLDCAPVQPLPGSTINNTYSVPSSAPTTNLSYPSYSYWTPEKAAEAEDYIRDVVYGGIDGLAYVRSLAEFVTPPEGQDFDINDQDIAPDLGMPLAKWVETNVVDPLTGNRHSILRHVGRRLAVPVPLNQKIQTTSDPNPIDAHLSRSLHVYPQAHEVLQLLQQLREQRIDMGSLIRDPNEIYLSDKEWHGNQEVAFNAQAPKAEESSALSELGVQVKKEEDSMDVDVDLQNLAGTSAAAAQSSGIFPTMEQLNQVFTYVADSLIALDKQRRADGIREIQGDVKMKFETDVKDEKKVDGPPPQEEDPLLRNIRLNLLALAKRAPLNAVAPLPREFVPEEIRHIIPTAPT